MPLHTIAFLVANSFRRKSFFASSNASILRATINPRQFSEISTTPISKTPSNPPPKFTDPYNSLSLTSFSSKAKNSRTRTPTIIPNKFVLITKISTIPPPILDHLNNYHPTIICSLNLGRSLKNPGKSHPITGPLPNLSYDLGHFTSLSHSSSFSSFTSTKTINPNQSSPRITKRHRLINRRPLDPPPNPAQFEKSLSQLPARFTPEDLSKTLIFQKDPQICLQLFNWASQQPRFKHDESTYYITIKKLGSAKLYEQMDNLASQVLSNSSIGSESLFNTIIYFYTEFRKLQKAITVYKHMKKSKLLNCRPSLRTYNLLFTSLLSRGSNSYINHMYMQTIRCLFRQMVDDGINPDIFSLNSMIKGYVLSLHLNDALRIFHQMEVVYNCKPSSHSYDYLIHGLCSQGRSINAKAFYREMVEKGFVPSCKAYNSLVNCLAIGGEVEESVNILWEMNWKKRMPDLITYRTVLDAICRQGRVAEAMGLLRELREKDLVDGETYRKLLHGLQDNYGDSLSTST